MLITCNWNTAQLESSRESHMRVECHLIFGSGLRRHRPVSSIVYLRRKNGWCLLFFGF